MTAFKWFLPLLALFALPLIFSPLAAQTDKTKDKDKQPEKKEDDSFLGKSVGEWIKILREHDNPKLRKFALTALEGANAASRTGRQAVLEATYRDKEPMVRAEAVLLLGRLGPETNGAFKALVEALQNDKSEAVREAAATAIGNEKFAARADEFIDALKGALKDPHAGTRVAVAAALRNMGASAEPAIPVLLESAKDPKEHEQVRLSAVHVVSRYGKNDKKTVPTLLELVKNTSNSPALREAAADGLGRAGSESADAVKVLCATLVEKSVDMRKASAVALGMMGSKAKGGWTVIKTRLIEKNEPDNGVRNHLIRLAGALAKAQPEAVPLLTDVAINDRSTENRIAAIQELGELGALPKASRDALSTIASQDARAGVREAAAKALKQVGGP